MTSVAFSQSDFGSIRGTVTDSSGAVVSGASVTVTNHATQRAVTVTTGNAGDYSVPDLNPDPYQIEVKAPNFKTLTQDVTVEVSQVVRLNLTLVAGSVSETVQVSSEAPEIDAASSSIGDVIEGKQVTELPLNGRNFTQLATLVPGVTRGPNINGNATGNQGNAETYRYNTSGGAALTVNGLRAQANNFLLDGFDNNESLVNTIIFFSSPDAIQEFQVQTNVAPAEFGRAGGAIVNTSIKSGTNQIHGSAASNFYAIARLTRFPGLRRQTRSSCRSNRISSAAVWALLSSRTNCSSLAIIRDCATRSPPVPTMSPCRPR